jgi:hypothetical protein
VFYILQNVKYKIITQREKNALAAKGTGAGDANKDNDDVQDTRKAVPNRRHSQVHAFFETDNP